MPPSRKKNARSSSRKRSTRAPRKQGALKRKYSAKTLKILFALTGGRCTEPSCLVAIVEPRTGAAAAIVVGQIAHIYAFKSNGPRGKPDLTDAERNAPDNLIVLCPTHHVKVDGQHAAYPAPLLQEWKLKRLAELRSGLGEMSGRSVVPVALIDREIDAELTRLRRSRFFAGFEPLDAAALLGNRLLNGELLGGSDGTRGRALAWCARLLLSRKSEIDGKPFLTAAQKLSQGEDVKIAEAFAISRDGDRAKALERLAALDTPLSRTASLFVVKTHATGPAEVLDWATQAGLTLAELDAEGRFLMIDESLRAELWDEALTLARALTEDTFDAAPVTLFTAARAHMLHAIPQELRPYVTSQIPLESESFKLIDTAEGLESRRQAAALLDRAALAARDVQCLAAAHAAEDLALWLRLRDPTSSDAALQHLKTSLSEPEHALRRVPLALRFDIPIDRDAVEKRIAREQARNGGVTPEAAGARFALAVAQNDATDTLAYLERYREELKRQIHPLLLGSIEAQSWARAGDPDKAEQVVKGLEADGLDTENAVRLRNALSAQTSADAVAEHYARYQQTGLITDLEDYARGLEHHQQWQKLAEIAPILFEKTSSVRDAERVAISLERLSRYRALYQFLKDHPDFIPQSTNLEQLWCWALFREGLLNESLHEVQAIKARGTVPRVVRDLEIQLRVASGDWESLSVLVEETWNDRAQREPKELLRAAQLGQVCKSPRVRELTFTAVERAPDDPVILAGAYALAVNNNFEKEPNVSGWIERAAERSKDQGPVKKASIQEVLARQPDWQRQEQDTWTLLKQGAAPLFLASSRVRKSLLEWTVMAALANVTRSDPRSRQPIPAFSGARRAPLPLPKGRLALDPTALLNATLLGILPQMERAYDGFIIAHSTLAWLFSERQQLAFHQPSRIQAAHELRGLLQTGHVQRFRGTAAADRATSVEVGTDLAALLAEAQAAEPEGVPRVVVISHPVHRVGSLALDDADLSAHAGVLCTIYDVIDRLKACAQITTSEERRARSYLKVNHSQPSSPRVLQAGTTLYLDDLPAHYLLRLGLLGRLKAAGLEPYLIESSVREAENLLAYEQVSTQALDLLETLRHWLAQGIASGRIRVAPLPESDERRDRLDAHPGLEIWSTLEAADVFVCDDRFTNQFAKTGDPLIRPIATSLNVLDGLKAGRFLSQDDYCDAHTSLRRWGFVFVPLFGDQLAHLVAAAAVVNGALQETAELKAIRENLRVARMSDFLRRPQENGWLDSLQKTVAFQMKEQWRANVDDATATARCEWLLNLIDSRGWAGALPADGVGPIIRDEYRAFLLMLAVKNVDMRDEDAARYFAWIDARLIGPAMATDPDLKESMALRLGQIVENAAAIADAEGMP